MAMTMHGDDNSRIGKTSQSLVDVASLRIEDFQRALNVTSNNHEEVLQFYRVQHLERAPAKRQSTDSSASRATHQRQRTRRNTYKREHNGDQSNDRQKNNIRPIDVQTSPTIYKTSLCYQKILHG
jgi:hypothetical protein